MGFNGSGVFTPDRANFPAVSGQTILASKFNNIINEIATGLTTCVTKDGQTTITANLPMSGFRHTGVGNGSARTDYASVAQLQDGGPTWLGSVSGSSTITGTATPSLGAYTAGQVVRFIPVGVNIGACTINVNSLGAKNIYAGSGAPLKGGELLPGMVANLVYDGTQFLLLNNAVDTRAENLVFNGRMELWQRGTSFAAISSASVSADGWRYSTGGTVAVHTVSRSTDVPTVAQAGESIPYSLLLTLTTPDTSIAAGDVVSMEQAIEGSAFRGYWQQPLLVSFWVKATTTGTYCFYVRNSTSRSYVTNFTISASDTWEQKTLLISASPSSGTWNLTPGFVEIFIGITLAAGSTFQTTADSWNAGGFYATSSQVNGVNTGSTSFRFTGMRVWQAHRGGLPYSRSFVEELGLSYRRYQKSFPIDTAPAQNSGYTGLAFRQNVGASVSDGVWLQYPNGHLLSAPAPLLYSPYNASNQLYNSTRSAAMTSSATSTVEEWGCLVTGTTTAGSAANDYIEFAWSVDTGV